MTAQISSIPQNVFQDAIYGFWNTRVAQAQTQTLAGKIDQGNRGSVTGGKQMDGFILTITNLLLASGVPQHHIHVKKSLTVIPGFFRPTKTYDFLVIDAEKKQLKVVIELKSQVGSFGNNFNNRTEEAMGAALDIWTAFREGVFGKAPPPPWIGYLLLLEDCDASLTPVRVSQPHFDVLPEFKQSSYAKRYELFCQKMVRERHYNAACFLMTDRDRVTNTPNYTEPSPDLSAANFLRQLILHSV
ncbi:PaeR7I family type II restriction endonuclease [Rivularia sp. UHCC 0363]|uniref:PaeR7I family type II restriction endonuclease n=1 Tax=Rivularia sp. UHCC 0363 TaxID=3110244 RepID=UPI002B21BCF2|nr:PaeR7I family type II restriction endonuclease [Rivularia sp. UHCC 0363]MEA5596909.1 PaeR7I family type II restriction endonuclease [Rivularia sp. UHCC 0363]